MRIILLTCLLLGGCVSTSPTEPAPVEVMEEETQLTPAIDYMSVVKEMIAERNRLQRQLYSISTYKLDLPVGIRDAIHCGDVVPSYISIPTSDYLRVAHAVATTPKQMEDILMDYIKALIITINEANRVLMDSTANRQECFDKFKPAE